MIPFPFRGFDLHCSEKPIIVNLVGGGGIPPYMVVRVHGQIATDAGWLKSTSWQHCLTPVLRSAWHGLFCQQLIPYGNLLINISRHFHLRSLFRLNCHAAPFLFLAGKIRIGQYFGNQYPIGFIKIIILNFDSRRILGIHNMHIILLI